MMGAAAQVAASSDSLESGAQDNRPVRDGFLVLGMHRSGTSAISGTLARLGIAPPKTLLEANEYNQRGYWESAELLKFHDQLLESAGSRWQDWRAFNRDWYASPTGAQFKERAKALFESEFGNAPAFVLKDPRICRFPRFWLELFAEAEVNPCIILPVREPLEVAQSLKTRDGFSIAHGLLLWLRHVLDAEEATRHMSRVIVPWSSFLTDWRSEAARISEELGVQWPRLTDTTAADVDGFLTAALKHENVSAEAVRAHPDMHDWITTAYDALLELTRNPTSTRAHTALDDIHARFDEAAGLFGGIVSGIEYRLGSLSGEFASVQHLRSQEQEEARQIAEALEHERAQAGELRRVHDEALASLEGERQNYAQELRTHAEALESERKRAGEMQRVHEETLASLQTTLVSERQSHEKEIRKQAGVLEDERARLEQLRHTHDDAAGAAQAMLVSERQAHRQILDDLESSRAEMTVRARTQDETLQALQATLAEERQDRAHETARHVQALEDMRVEAAERHRTLEEQTASERTQAEAEFNRIRAEFDEVAQQRDVLQASLSLAVEKIARAKTRPIRSVARWLMGRPI